jgi:peptidyl-tRNA hydrolase
MSEDELRNSLVEDTISHGEDYYNQTFNQKEETLEEWKSKFTHHCAVKNNQKQHIIDIMKADEDDGLYKTFDTDPDKKH